VYGRTLGQIAFPYNTIIISILQPYIVANQTLMGYLRDNIINIININNIFWLFP